MRGVGVKGTSNPEGVITEGHVVYIAKHSQAWRVHLERYMGSGPIVGYDHHGTGFLKPFRSAVPFWGQTTQISSVLSPERDCSPINPFRTAVPC